MANATATENNRGSESSLTGAYLSLLEDMICTICGQSGAIPVTRDMDKIIRKAVDALNSKGGESQITWVELLRQINDNNPQQYMYPPSNQEPIRNSSSTNELPSHIVKTCEKKLSSLEAQTRHIQVTVHFVRLIRSHKKSKVCYRENALLVAESVPGRLYNAIRLSAGLEPIMWPIHSVLFRRGLATQPNNNPTPDIPYNPGAPMMSPYPAMAARAQSKRPAEESPEAEPQEKRQKSSSGGTSTTQSHGAGAETLNAQFPSQNATNSQPEPSSGDTPTERPSKAEVECLHRRETHLLDLVASFRKEKEETSTKLDAAKRQLIEKDEEINRLRHEIQKLRGRENAQTPLQRSKARGECKGLKKHLETKVSEVLSLKQRSDDLGSDNERLRSENQDLQLKNHILNTRLETESKRTNNMAESVRQLRKVLEDRMRLLPGADGD